MNIILEGPISPRKYGLKVKEFHKRVLRILTNMKGYYIAEVEKPNSVHGTQIKLHELVLYTHLNIPMGTFKQKLLNIHHIDGEKSNNHFKNLLLISSSDHDLLHDCERLNRKYLTGFIVAKWKVINWKIKYFYPLFNPEKYCV